MNSDIKQFSGAGTSPSLAEPSAANPPQNQMFRDPQSGALAKPAGPAESSLKKDGTALKDKAMERLATEADTRKEGVSKQLKSVSGALQAAESELSKKDGDAAEWLKSGLHQVVSTIEQLAERVENKDSAELIGEVKSFARDNPKTFLAACALAGFAAARVFKVGSQDDSPQNFGGTTTGMGGQS